MKTLKQNEGQKKFVAQLNRMSYQQIFSRVLKSIQKQGKAAWDSKNGTCMYLTKDNLKCAVGQLVPAGVKLTEGYAVCSLVSLGQLKGLCEKKVKFIKTLQDMHDHVLLYENLQIWKQNMRNFAEQKGLKYS